jgi:hypothetical protein
VTRRQQRLGDLVAGTLVLRERTAVGPVDPIRFEVPPGAEAYARTVDVGGLDADDYAAVRSFLTRAADLDPAPRATLGRALAQRLAAKLSHVPPPTVTPELFLVVAAARYQTRFDPAVPPVPSAPAEPTRPAPPPPNRGSFAPPS